MCDVMPTISEDGSNDRESQGSGDDSNFEQLMVNMLDERDKLMESLREKQEALEIMEAKLLESNKDRELMQKQLQQTTPQVIKSDVLARSLNLDTIILTFMILIECSSNFNFENEVPTNIIRDTPRYGSFILLLFFPPSNKNISQIYKEGRSAERTTCVYGSD